MSKRKREDKESDSDDDDTMQEAKYLFLKDRTKKYTKKTLIEHILSRPDSYVGSIEKATEKLWVYNFDTKIMEKKNLTYVPALFKIFDEILVNAADNKFRDSEENDSFMNYIKVDIDQDEGKIVIENDGQSIPVEMKEEDKVYCPELCFGVLLTGSNFDDDEKRMIGGRNGYGAKLTNIYSKKFMVEVNDPDKKKKYKQQWSQNMSVRGKPSIKSSNRKSGYVRVTFYPDLGRLKYVKLDDDIVALMKRRVFDMAGIVPGIKVSLNGKRIKVKNFRDYVKLYPITNIAYEKVNDRWSIAVAPTTGDPDQVSFVNGINTYKGGKHVEHVIGSFAKKVLDKVKKRNKGASIGRKTLTNHLFVFVKCRIINPTFDSQTKGELTTVSKKFGSKCKVKDDFVKRIIKTGLTKILLKFAQYKKSTQLKGLSGTKKKRLRGIAKLDDANFAGTKKSDRCTLILTEGDSAKTLAICGLSMIGRDKYGVFPLRGKPLNVRGAKHDRVMKNEEISNIIKIMGLKVGKEYKTKEDLKGMRYGSVMIMADQDYDGSHIKGLLVNFFHFFWPDLLSIKGFLKEFITPIVRVSKKRPNIVKYFYTVSEYETWRKENKEGWDVKYYKGLGANSSEEGRQYFSNLKKHQLKFVESEKYGDKVKLAFDPKLAEKRKDWINGFEDGTFIDQSKGIVSYGDFIDKELISYSIYNVQRSIPSVVDGLKPGQRKILFACFKKKLKKQIKVSQLGGYVSLHTGYHHGEKSLNESIIKMAQTYVGSNNINLLSPEGQFGTRLLGGADSASPRYIFTKLSDITRSLFISSDDLVLKYLDDDGKRVEPEFYVPVIPMVLVNGSKGIGTGWSTSIPMFNPEDIVKNVKRMMKGEEPVDMNPWYKGFKGEIVFKSSNSYESKGIIEKIDESSLLVSNWSGFSSRSDMVCQNFF